MSALSADTRAAFMSAADAPRVSGPECVAAAASDSGDVSPSGSDASASTDSASASVAPAPAAGMTTPAATERSHGPLLRAGGELGHALHSLGSDAVYVATSPLRLDKEGALWTAAVIGTGLLIYSEDQALYDDARRSRGNGVYDAALNMGENLEPVGLMGRTWPYWTGLWAVAKVARIEVLQQIPAEVLESHFIAGGIRNGGKLLLGRRRPFEGFGPRKFELNGGTSFPSGHTSVVFEIATVLSHHARRWPVTVATYALATTVAVQRVESGNHWASDCFIPAVTGTVIAHTVVLRNQQRRGNSGTAGSVPDVPARRAQFSLVPVVGPGGGGLRIEARF